MSRASKTPRVVQLSGDAPNWVTAIKRHGDLLKIYVSESKLRSELAHHMNKVTNSDDPADPYAVLTTLPSILRSRMALRHAVKSVQFKSETAPTAEEVLRQEYMFLTKRLKQRRLEIRKFEKQILATSPQTAADAKHLLGFLSTMVASRRRVDRNLLSNALKSCESVLGFTVNLPTGNTANTAAG